MVHWWILGAGFPIDTRETTEDVGMDIPIETPIGLWARVRELQESGPQAW